MRSNYDARVHRNLKFLPERHLNYVNREWRLHYNRERPHEARGHLPPGMETPTTANETVRLNDVVYSLRLGGLLKHYEWRAA